MSLLSNQRRATAYLKGAWRLEVCYKAAVEIREVRLNDTADLGPQLVNFFHGLYRASGLMFTACYKQLPSV